MTDSTTPMNCCICNVLLRNTTGQKLKLQTPLAVSSVIRIFGINVSMGNVLCSKCRAAFYKRKAREVEDELCAGPSHGRKSPDPTFHVAESKPKPSLELVEMDFARVISTHKYCFLCHSSENIVTVPFETRQQVFSRKRIFIAKGNRCCAIHLIKNRLYEDEFQHIRIYSTTSFIDVEDLRRFLVQLSIKSEAELVEKIGDFSLSEERLKVFTGLTWDNLIELRNMLTSLKNSQSRDTTQALVTFLFKLRTGFHAKTREELIENETSPVAKKLHQIGNRLALIFDGTYISHQKSSNNEYQRRSFSGQKKKSLYKPFTITTTNGYVVDTVGPFSANQNDATILEKILNDPNGLAKLMKPGDICIVDRGFRDIKDKLTTLGYSVLMPALKGQRKQLTTVESNESRFVTKIRWAVEAIHGILGEKFKMLHQQVDNKLLPKMSSYCRIASFLNNKFGVRLHSDIELLEQIVAQMELKKSTDNTLAREVEEGHLGRRSLPFEQLSAHDIIDFPELTTDDLKIFFTDFIPLSTKETPPERKQIKTQTFRRPKKTSEELKQIKLGRKKRRARLIVRNISFKSNKKNLLEHFSTFGKVEELDLLKKPDGKLVGCAFVQYEKINDAAKAILMNSGKELLGRTIYVDWAVGKDQYEKQIKKATVTIKVETDEIKSENEDVVEVKEESTDDEMDSVDEQSKEIKEENDSQADDDEIDKKVIKKRSNDVSEGCTVFIKNVPFEATNDDLWQCCKKFGPISYGLITKDRISGHSKGTGFVKFKNKESAQMCLSAGTELRLFNQVLDPCIALSRHDIQNKTEEAKRKEAADSRNLYLSTEGVIVANTPAAEDVSVSDMAKRLHLERVKSQILKNLNRFLSKERLTIHNIPDSFDSMKLRKIIETHTKLKPKECRIMRENKPSMGQPLGASKGFGFVSFKNHPDALACLRKLNNNPNVFGKNNRPIVSFSIEDKAVHNIKQKRLEMSKAKNPTFHVMADKKLLKKSKRKLDKDEKVLKKKKEKKIVTTEVNGQLDSFAGLIAERRADVRSRPKWKLNEQAQMHRSDVKTLKKEQKKLRDKRMLNMEKREVDRTKIKRKGNEVDNFSFMVDKYKKLIDSNQPSGPKRMKRSKWYTE